MAEASSRLYSFMKVAMSAASSQLAAVACQFSKEPEFPTSTRHASGSFIQEMSYNRMDNPNLRFGLFTYADGWANPFKCGRDKSHHHFHNNALVLDLKKEQFNDPGSKSGN